MSGRAGPKARPGRTHAPVMSRPSIVVFLVRGNERTGFPDSRQGEARFPYSRSRRRRRPPDVWWHRTCVAWRSFRTRGRFACRRRTLALLRRHPPAVRPWPQAVKRHGRVLVAETSGRAGEWARSSPRRRWRAARLRRRSSASPSIRTTGACAEDICFVMTACYDGRWRGWWIKSGRER